LGGTTEADWQEASFVMSKEACTYNELATFKSRASDEEFSFSPGDDGGYDMTDEGQDDTKISTYLTDSAHRMQREIAASASMCDKMTVCDQQSCWKNCTEDCKAVIGSNLSRRRKLDFEREVSMLRTRYLSELTPLESVGGDNRIEMCASNNDRREKRASRYLQSTDYRK